MTTPATPPPMTPRELRRLSDYVRAFADDADHDDEAADLVRVADFLNDVAGTLDVQAQIRRQRAARQIINARRARARTRRGRK